MYNVYFFKEYFNWRLYHDVPDVFVRLDKCKSLNCYRTAMNKTRSCGKLKLVLS